jgi:hypothetical protein
VAIFRAFRGLTTVTQEIFHELEKNWQPVKGDFAAHGRFDKCAKPGTAQLWTTLYREPITLALLAACWRLRGNSVRLKTTGR